MSKTDSLNEGSEVNGREFYSESIIDSTLDYTQLDDSSDNWSSLDESQAALSKSPITKNLCRDLRSQKFETETGRTKVPVTRSSAAVPVGKYDSTSVEPNPEESKENGDDRDRYGSFLSIVKTNEAEKIQEGRDDGGQIKRELNNPLPRTIETTFMNRDRVPDWKQNVGELDMTYVIKTGNNRQGKEMNKAIDETFTIMQPESKSTIGAAVKIECGVDALLFRETKEQLYAGNGDEIDEEKVKSSVVEKGKKETGKTEEKGENTGGPKGDTKRGRGNRAGETEWQGEKENREIQKVISEGSSKTPAKRRPIRRGMVEVGAEERNEREALQLNLSEKEVDGEPGGRSEGEERVKGREDEEKEAKREDANKGKGRRVTERTKKGKAVGAGRGESEEEEEKASEMKANAIVAFTMRGRGKKDPGSKDKEGKEGEVELRENGERTELEKGILPPPTEKHENKAKTPKKGEKTGRKINKGRAFTENWKVELMGIRDNIVKEEGDEGLGEASPEKRGAVGRKARGKGKKENFFGRGGIEEENAGGETVTNKSEDNDKRKAIGQEDEAAGNEEGTQNAKRTWAGHGKMGERIPKKEKKDPVKRVSRRKSEVHGVTREEEVEKEKAEDGEIGQERGIATIKEEDVGTLGEGDRDVINISEESEPKIEMNTVVAVTDGEKANKEHEDVRKGNIPNEPKMKKGLRKEIKEGSEGKERKNEDTVVLPARFRALEGTARSKTGGGKGKKKEDERERVVGRKETKSGVEETGKTKKKPGRRLASEEAEVNNGKGGEKRGEVTGKKAGKVGNEAPSKNRRAVTSEKEKLVFVPKEDGEKKSRARNRKEEKTENTIKEDVGRSEQGLTRKHRERKEEPESKKKTMSKLANEEQKNEEIGRKANRMAGKDEGKKNGKENKLPAKEKGKKKKEKS